MARRPNQVSMPNPEFGVDFDASARAMHQSASKRSLMVHETARFGAAALGKSPRATMFERNTMLKTLKRKIALVAVSVLGASGLAVVAAPAANAVDSDITKLTLSSAWLRTGVGGGITVTLTGSETDTASLLRGRVLSAPVGSTLGVGGTTGIVSGANTGGTTFADGEDVKIELPVGLDKDGSYQFLVWVDETGAAGGGVDDASPSTSSIPSLVVTVATSGAPASIALDKTAYTGVPATDVVVKATPKDSSGKVTALAVGEFLTASGTVGSLTTLNGAWGAYGANNLATAAQSRTSDGTAGAGGLDLQNSDGSYTLTVQGGAAGVGTLNVGSAGAIAGLTAQTVTVTTATPTYATRAKVTNTASMANSNNGTTIGTLASAATPDVAFAAAGNTDANDGTDTELIVIASTAAKDVTFRVGSTDATTISKTLKGVRVGAYSTTVSLPAGVTADTADRTVTLSAATSTTAFTGQTTAWADITVSSTAPLAGTGYKLTVPMDANDNIVIKVIYASPNVANGVGSMTVSPTDGEAAKATLLGGATVTATVKDQFGDVFNGANVIFTITGRNAQTKTVATGSNGKAAFTYTDAGTSTTVFKDTFSVTAAAPTSSTFLTAVATQINWATSAALSVDTVTVAPVAHADVATSGGDFTTTARGVAVGNANLSYTATVKNASGIGIGGVAVVFTADSGAAVATTGAKTATVYTNATGVASWAVIPTGGVVKISAAAGGKTGSNEVVTGFAEAAGTVAANVFTAGTAGNQATARTIAMKDATASVVAGNATRITASVKDRFGNGVPFANVTFTVAGTVGRFGGGTLSVTTATDKNGDAIADFVALAGESGTATVTATIVKAGSDISTATLTSVGGAYPAGVYSGSTAVTITAASAAANPALDAVKTDVKAVSDTVATLSKAVTTIQSSVTELTSSFSAQIKSLSSAIAKISRAIAALSKKIK